MPAPQRSGHSQLCWDSRTTVDSLRIRQFEFSPDFDELVCAGTVNSHVVVANWTGHNRILGAVRNFGRSSSDAVLGLCWFRQNNARFLAGSSAGCVRIVDASQVAVQGSGGATDTAFLPVPDLPVLHSFQPWSDLTCVHVNCDDSVALCSGYRNDVELLDLGTGRSLRTLHDVATAHINITRFAQGHPHLFATSSFDKTVAFWDTRTDKRIFQLHSARPNVTLSFSADDTFLLTSAVDNEVRAYSVGSGRHYMRMDLPETGRPDNYTRAYFCPSFIPSSDDPRASLDPSALVVSGSSEENVLRLSEVASGRLVASMNLYDGRKTEAAGVYVQSLRAHPMRPGIVGVLVGSRDPSVDLHMTIVDASGGAPREVDRGTAGGTYAVSEENELRASAMPLSSLPGTGSGPPPPAVRGMMMSILIQGVNELARLTLSELEAHTEGTAGKSVSSVGMDTMLFSGPWPCGAADGQLSAFHVPCHRGILLARHPGLSAVLARASTRCMENGMTCVHLGCSSGLSAPVLSTLLLWAYGNEFIPQPAPLTHAQREEVRAWSRCSVSTHWQNLVGYGAAELSATSTYASPHPVPSTPMRCRAQRWEDGWPRQVRLGPLVQAITNDAAELSAERKAVFIHCKDMLLQDPPSVCLEARICKSEVGKGATASAGTIRTPIEWHSLCTAVNTNSAPLCDRKLDLLSAVAVGLLAAHIGGSEGLAAAVVARVHPGVDGHSELCPGIVVPLLALCCEAGARVEALTLLCARGENVVDVEGLLTREGLLPRLCSASQGAEGQFNLAATVLAVSVVAFCVQHYRHLAICGILQSLDDTVGMSVQTCHGSDEARHKDKRVKIQQVGRAAADSGQALKEFASLIHSAYGAQQTAATVSAADAATRDMDSITVGPATASMQVGAANITLAVGQLQVRASSAELEAATSLMCDLTTASRKEGVASARQLEIYGSTAQCPLRPYSALSDPLFCDNQQAPQGVPCMFLHSASMVSVHGCHRLVALGGAGEGSSHECNLQPQAPWVLDCGGKISAGVWSHEATSGPVPPALLKHSSVSLPGGRFMLVYPGCSTTAGDTGPGSLCWLSSPADKATEASQAADSAHTAHRTVLSSVLSERHVSQQDRDGDNTTVELPVIGAPPSAHPVGLQALMHSRIWMLDTKTNEWTCITPAWPDMSSSMQHLSWTLATSAEGKLSSSDSRQKLATRAGSQILALQSCTPCIPRESHISALLEAPWCFPHAEQGAGGPAREYFHMLTYGGFAVNPDPCLQRVSPSLDSGGRMMILRHLRMLIGTLTTSDATGRQQWSFEWTTPSVAGVEPPLRVWAASCVLPMTIESPLHTCPPDNGPVMLMHGGMAATGRILDELWLLSVDGPAQACLLPGSSESSPRFTRNLAFRWHQVSQVGPLSTCARSNHTLTSVWSILRGREGASGQTLRQAINEDIARRTAILFGGQRPDSAQTSTLFTDKLMVLSVTHEPPAALSGREHGRYTGTWSTVDLTLSPGRGLRADDEVLPSARDLHTCTYAPLWPVRETESAAMGQQPPAAAIAVPGPFLHPHSAAAELPSAQASMIMSAHAYTKLEGRTVQEGWNVNVARLASSIPVSTLLPGAFLVFGGFSDKRRVEQDGQSESSMYLRDKRFTLKEAVTTGILHKSSPFAASVAAHLSRVLGHTAGPATQEGESEDEEDFEDARGEVEAPAGRGSNWEHEGTAMDVRQDHEEDGMDDEGEEGGGEEGDWGDHGQEEEQEEYEEQEEEEQEEYEEEEEEQDQDHNDEAGENAPGPRAAQWRRGAGPPPDPDEWDEDSYRRRRHVDSILHALVLALAPAPTALVRCEAEQGEPASSGRYAHLLPALLQELSAAEAELLLYGLHESSTSVAYKARVHEAWHLVKAGRQCEAAERLQLVARASAPAPEEGMHPPDSGLDLVAVGTWSRPPVQVATHPGVRIPQGPAPLWANDLEKLLPTANAPPAVQIAGDVLIQTAFLPADSEGAYRTIPFLRSVLTARFPALAPMFVPSGRGGGSSSAYAEGQSGTLLLSQAPGLHAFRLVTGPVDDPQQDADLGYQVLLALLRWALTGGVEPTTGPEEAMALLAAADAWGASDCAVLAEAILLRHIGPDSVLGLLQYAEGYLAVQAAEGKGASLSAQVQHSGPGSLLRSACQSFILRNFRQISSGPDWQLLPDRIGAALEEQWSSGGHAFATDAGN